MKTKNTSSTISFANLGGTSLKLHLSLLLFIAWIFFENSTELPTLASKLLLIGIFFCCLLLHEAAHLIASKAFQIKFTESILYPFGGDLKTSDKSRPAQELVIMMAGPLFNLLVALVCTFISDINLRTPISEHAGLITRIYYVNLLLGLVNLVPAAPLDGARIMQAAFKMMKLPNTRQLSTSISQFSAILFSLAMLFTANILAIIVGAVILVRAIAEHLYNRIRNAAVGLKVSDVMTEAAQLVILQHRLPVSQCLRLALRSFQPAFPVMYGEQLIGLIERQSLIELTASFGADSYISGHVDRNFVKLAPEQSLDQLIDLINVSGLEIFLVTSDDQLRGLVTKDRLLEYLVVQELHKRAVETENILDQEF